MTEGLNDIMINAVKLLTSTLNDEAKSRENATAEAFRSVDGMNRTLNLMQSLKLQIETVRNTMSDDENDNEETVQVKRRRIEQLEKAYNKTFETLGKFE